MGKPISSAAAMAKVHSSNQIVTLSDKTVILKIDKERLQKEYGSVIKSIADAGSDVVLFGEKEGK
jgi:hypothetical protein